MLNIDAIYFLKGSNNSNHKIDALQALVPNHVIPAIVTATEPDHHADPVILLRAKYEAFSKAWTPPTGVRFITAVADVTTDYGNKPIRKPIATSFDDLAGEIVETTTQRGERKYIRLTEHAGILFSQGQNTKAGFSTTTTSLPTRPLKDIHLVNDLLQFSALGEAHLNISGGLDASSILAFLSAENRLGNKQPRELVSIPPALIKNTEKDPSYIFKRLYFYDSIGRIKPYHLKYLESLTLLALLESALNIPGHLAIPLLDSLFPL